MVTPKTIRSKRIAGDIAGQVLCVKLGITRTRLSDIERGYLKPADEELQRIDSALDQLLAAKETLRQTAVALGWPTEVVR
jgi:ribosome-binding protein aMBF1 (putative translation factor)